MVYSGNETLRLHGEARYALAHLPGGAHLVLDAPWGYALRALPHLSRVPGVPQLLQHHPPDLPQRAHLPQLTRLAHPLSGRAQGEGALPLEDVRQ